MIAAEQTAVDRHLIDRLRARDASAFEELLDRYHRHLLPLARYYVSSREAAEDVVQETWLAVLEGIDRFEERSSLKTWLSRIVMNRARTRAVREKRLVPFSALSGEENTPFEPAVDPERFRNAEPYRGHWASVPKWSTDPEHDLLGEEAMNAIRSAVAALPRAQQLVITLRDINGWDAQEVCNVLEISETNQRVLLHRARSKVRSAVDDYFQRKAGAA